MNDQYQAYQKIWAGWTPESIAEQIADHQNRRLIYLALVEKWLPQAEKGASSRILEIGCGTSIDAHLIAQKTKSTCFGIDLSPESIKKAQQVAASFDNKVILDVQDARHMTFDNDSFDLLFSQGVLEHFEDPDQAIDEQLRVLKPNGVLLISVPQTFTAYTLYKHLLMTRGKWPWGKETEFSFGRLKKIAKKHNLTIVETAGYDYWRHPCEFAWILRSLNQKRKKIKFLKNLAWLNIIFEKYDRWWDRLEKKSGHLFMKNIVVVYRPRT